MSYADLSRLAEAVLERRAAEQDFEAAVKELFPVGSIVPWKLGDHVFSGPVLAHGVDGAIKVRNPLTSKTRWIDWYKMLNAVRITDSTPKSIRDALWKS